MEPSFVSPHHCPLRIGHNRVLPSREDTWIEDSCQGIEGRGQLAGRLMAVGRWLHGLTCGWKFLSYMCMCVSVYIYIIYTLL